MKLIARAFAGLAASCISATGGHAATLGVTAFGGVMQQPTSHYYLAMYGAAFESGSASQKLLGRVHYLERPEFRSLGYADKDSGWFAQIGSKVSGPANHGLRAFFGAGRVEGYIRANPDQIEGLTTTIRRYALPGPTASLEYIWRVRGIDLSAGHQTFIGYMNEVELKTYVAWPYNFFTLAMGRVW